MSECVVRMELPHDGLCDLAYSFLDRTFCTIEGLTCKYCDDEARPDWCPILAVLPEKHGRLVDADELESRCRPVKNFENQDGLVIGVGPLRCSKTIIPATEGGNHEDD